MSTLEVNKITPVDGGTTVQVGESGDTINIPAGATIANAGTASGFAPTGITSAMTSGTGLAIDSAGLVTKPLQCGVVWKPTNNSGSIAADTTHTIGSGNSTEIIDRNGDFSGNTFTAPVTGLYFLSMNLYVNSYDHDNNWSGAWIDTSNRRYQMWFLAGNALSVDGSVQMSGGSVADMDAGDTAVWQFRNDQGTQQPVINQERTVLGAWLLG